MSGPHTPKPAWGGRAILQAVEIGSLTSETGRLTEAGGEAVGPLRVQNEVAKTVAVEACQTAPEMTRASSLFRDY